MFRTGIRHSPGRRRLSKNLLWPSTMPPPRHRTSRLEACRTCFLKGAKRPPRRSGQGIQRSQTTFNLIHRSPGPAGRPEITDFGLAKRLDDDQVHTRTGDVVRTPAHGAGASGGKARL